MDHTMISDILGTLLEHLGLAYDKIDVSEEADIVRVDITSSIASKIIGWHGETLNSIQHMLKSIIREKEKMERSPFIVVDVDGYRRSQEDKVRSMAEQKADFVRRSGNRIALPPMSPYFRRIVHLHIANDPKFADLTTESAGDGGYRQVIMCLKDGKAPTDANAEVSEELSPVMADDTTEGGFDNLDI